MMTVVVTGGIGSGKSLVCRILNEEFGWPVYNADSRVKQLYVSHPTLLSEIEVALGERFRDDEGTFQPSSLARKIFSDNAALLKVEGLVFPFLTEDFEQWKQKNSQSEYIILESATILEKPQLRTMGDKFVLIDAPVDVRIKRVMVRDGLSDEQVTARLANQPLMNSYSNGTETADVDYIILNDSSVENLREKVADFVRNIG